MRDASAIILPGVGAFPEAMRNLERTGLGEALIERAAAGVPLLGICLGMQLLFESSTEHEGAAGLGILPGTVTALESPRLPHIGWNLVTFERESALTEGLGEAAAFYHVHSFACRPVRPRRCGGHERVRRAVRLASSSAATSWPRSSTPRSPRWTGCAMLRNFAALATVAA